MHVKQRLSTLVTRSYLLLLWFFCVRCLRSSVAVRRLVHLDIRGHNFVQSRKGDVGKVAPTWQVQYALSTAEIAFVFACWLTLAAFASCHCLWTSGWRFFKWHDNLSQYRSLPSSPTYRSEFYTTDDCSYICAVSVCMGMMGKYCLKNCPKTIPWTTQPITNCRYICQIAQP